MGAADLQHDIFPGPTRRPPAGEREIRHPPGVGVPDVAKALGSPPTRPFAGQLVHALGPVSPTAPISPAFPYPLSKVEPPSPCRTVDPRLPQSSMSKSDKQRRHFRMGPSALARYGVRSKWMRPTTSWTCRALRSCSGFAFRQSLWELVVRPGTQVNSALSAAVRVTDSVRRGSESFMCGCAPSRLEGVRAMPSAIRTGVWHFVGRFAGDGLATFFQSDSATRPAPQGPVSRPTALRARQTTLL
jgi:hypothetical protein